MHCFGLGGFFFFSCLLIFFDFFFVYFLTSCHYTMWPLLHDGHFYMMQAPPYSTATFPCPRYSFFMFILLFFCLFFCLFITATSLPPPTILLTYHSLPTSYMSTSTMSTHIIWANGNFLYFILFYFIHFDYRYCHVTTAPTTLLPTSHLLPTSPTTPPPPTFHPLLHHSAPPPLFKQPKQHIQTHLLSL